MEGEKKGITRNVFLLGLVSFFTDFSSDMIFILLPDFVKGVLGAGTVALGAIEGFADSTAALTKLVSGKLSDYLGKRKLFAVIGYGLSTVARPLWAFATMALHGVAIRFGDRVGKGVRTAPRDALIASSTAPQTRGRAFGFQRALDHAGAVVGAGACAVLLWTLMGAEPSEKNMRRMFLLAAVPGAVAFLILLFGVREKAAPPAEKGGEVERVALPRAFKLYALTMVLFTLGNSSDIFLLWRARNVGEASLSLPGVAVLWAVFHVVKSVSATPGGILSDRLGRKGVIVAGWVVYALVYAGFAFAASAWHIWALFSVYGLYHGLCEGTEKAFVADLVPEEKRGTGYGWFNFAIGVTALPSSLVFGWVLGADWGGPGVAFLYGAGLSAVSSVLLLALVRPRRKEAEDLRPEA